MSKNSYTPYAVDYIALITIVLVQVLFIYIGSDLIEDTFGTLRFAPIIVPLMAIITYTLYFGSTKLAFAAGFLLTISTQIYYLFLDFPQSIYFVSNFPQSAIVSVILGVLFGLIGVLFSTIRKNSGFVTRISINALMLLSVSGIHTLFGRPFDIGFWLSFNSALIVGLSLSYYILHNAGKAFVFTFLSIVIMFSIIKYLLKEIFLYRSLPENLIFGIVIAISLASILMAYHGVRKLRARI